MVENWAQRLHGDWNVHEWLTFIGKLNVGTTASLEVIVTS